MNDNSVQMVLLEYREFTRLKKTQEEYHKLVAKKSQEKVITEPEVKINSDSEDLKGHGSGDSYNVSVPDAIPDEFVDKPTIYDEVTSLVPKKHKLSARKLVSDLKKRDSIQWCSGNGEITIKKKKIPGSKLKEILPKVFTGLRAGQLQGEEDFMDYLKEIDLEHYIKSVKAKDWFYIGKP